MSGVLSALLRAGLAVKLGHLRQATSSYMQDRMDQGRSKVSGYAVGGAFYAAAGIFLIAALLVGAAALFRWVEMKYGVFHAFGATAIVLVALTLLCAIIAATAMRPPSKDYSSLGSRLKAALYFTPSKAKPKLPAAPTPLRLPAERKPGDARDHVASARNTATSILRTPSVPKRTASSSDNSPMVKSAGAAAAVGLLGWALSRRYNRPPAPAPLKRRR